MELNNLTTRPIDNTTKDKLLFDNTLFLIETWLTITLSCVSSLTILFITILYIVAHVKSRDHVKETRKFIIKKLIKNEYLVISYILCLLASHIASILHKLISKYYVYNLQKVNSLCLSIGILTHSLWLLTLFHSNAVSFKIYLKLSKSLNGNLSDKKNWLKSATKIFSYIYGATILIMSCSVSIHFGISESNVYEHGQSDKINSCFLSQPLYLIVFFAFPILIILSVNTTLFLIVYLKTKATIDNSESDEMNNLFLKLATIMGLSWFLYVFGVVIIEIFPNHLMAQIIVLVTSCQVNLQGFFIVIGLFWSACYELLFKKKTSKNRGVNKNNNANPNNNNNNNIQNKFYFNNNITVL
ncbi:unnamed protein product [Brachionus calyciflorus]|uniref:G-protein coupled receptors family 2 profile 2 domain-containing protein n=1 Tax=Brachionus calyciflorus TaxID=104777 RepID=A0A814HW29_9BILA|nr:unnamed protein product [Brachionus calyciflorus]